METHILVVFKPTSPQQNITIELVSLANALLMLEKLDYVSFTLEIKTHTFYKSNFLYTYTDSSIQEK